MTGPDIAATRRFGEEVDFGRTAREYQQHRQGFPPAFFEAVNARGFAKPGQRVLDLGSGTGTVARGLALLGLEATAIDPAEALIEAARQLDRQADVEIDYHVGKAEALPFAYESFDLVTAGQCWHWFDRAAASQEARRVLRPGGRLLIAHFDWLPLPGNVVEATERLIVQANPNWSMSGGTGIYPLWLGDLANAGFRVIETFSFDLPVAYSHEAWRGRIAASAGIKASLKDDEVERFDLDLADVLREQFPADPLDVPHRVWVATGTRP
jgi:SAM-dependent methyltransferase